jgi:hypothetical protein
MEANTNQPGGMAGTVDGLPYELIARRIRDDSRDKARLTSLETISGMIGEPAKVRSFLSGLVLNEDYKDIKIIVAVSGSTYLFSETYLSRDFAEKLAFGEEVKSQIARQVREDSSKKIGLTSINTLGTMIPGAEADRIDNHLMSLLDDERFKDIHLVANSRETRYLYSDQFMTGTYAGILAQAEAHDPLATIADIVREESRIYPRPTALTTFNAPVYNINPDELGKYADDLVTRPEYSDIKSVLASTGTRYLYSETFINRDFVKAAVEWEEVGRYLNP